MIHSGTTNHCHPHHGYWWEGQWTIPPYAPSIDPYQYAAPLVWPTAERVPHKCPVCKGRGRVKASFYEDGNVDDAKRVACRSCEGRGLVWDPAR